MDFQVTKNNVRDIVSRLRQAVGIEGFTRSAAFEALAQTLGFKNWDTLSGILGREEHPVEALFTLERPVEVFILGTPVELYIDAFACDDNMQGPSWAKVTITQAFLNEVLRLRDICRSQGVDLVSTSKGPDKWDSEESLRLERESLYVTANSWWFRARPKHQDYAVETRSLDIDQLLATLAGGPDDGFLVRRQDKLFYNAAGDTSFFIEVLVDDGELDESFAED